MLIWYKSHSVQTMKTKLNIYTKYLIWKFKKPSIFCSETLIKLNKMGDKSTKNVCHNFQCLHVRIAYLGKKSSPSLQPPLGPEAFELPYTCNMVHLLSPNYRYNVKLADSYCWSLKTCCLFPDPFTGKLPNMISGCL